MTKSTKLSESELVKLPYDVSRKIMIEELSVRDILNLCGANKQFNTNVCTEEFWQHLAQKRFEVSDKQKYESYKDLVIHLDFLRELDQRTNDLLNYFKTINPNIKLFIKKGRVFWEVKTDDYYKNTKFRIQTSTGDVFSPSGKKIEFNIIEDPYGGKGHFSVSDINRNDPYPGIFYPETVKNIPKYESIILTKKEEESIKDKYTLQELEGKNKKELVRIYRGLGMKNEGGLNIEQLKKSIVAGKKFVFETEDYPKYAFKVGQNVVLSYSLGGHHTYDFGKVIFISKTGNPKIQLYEKKTVERDPGYYEMVQPVDQLTNTKFGTRYSKKEGYRTVGRDYKYGVYSPEEVEFSFEKKYKEEY